MEAGNKVGQTNINVCYTDATGKEYSQQVSVDVSIPSNLYTWKAYDWYRNRVSDRLSATDIKYSNKDNTITITKTGAQNIALRYREKRFMEPGVRYFVAVATNVSNTKTDSQLWHINGKWVNIVNPDVIQALQDGRTLLAWKIDEVKGYEETGETVFGLTSTDAKGKSVISYVGFVKDIETLVKSLNEAVGIAVPTASVAPTTTTYNLSGIASSQPVHSINITHGRKGLVQ